jgi:hypothetical protein
VTHRIETFRFLDGCFLEEAGGLVRRLPVSTTAT